jgi:hypothetical protein
MTAQVQFFCSPQEEHVVLERLTADPALVVFLLDGQRMTELPEFSSHLLSPWPEFVCLYIWAKLLGPIQWHEKRPKVEGTTQRSFVARLFAREHWDKSGIAKGEKLLDQDLSPGICYKRPEIADGRTGPCTLIAPPSNLKRVGTEYEKWVNRYLGWIRRRGKLVHDWRSPSTVLPNQRGLLNTVYAFPEALKEIESGEHSFAIL